MRHLVLYLPCGTHSEVQSKWKERKKEKRKTERGKERSVTAKHIFSYLFFQGLHFNHSNRRLLNVLIYYIFNFTFWWQIGHPRNAATRPRGCAQDENAFPMSRHDRMRVLGCHCGLELTARFTTCNSVTSSGTLDTLHFVRGGSHCLFSLSDSDVEFKVTETRGPQGGWVKHHVEQEERKHCEQAEQGQSCQKHP